MKTHDNTILITGGSTGLGFALAKRFLELGNKVIVTGRDIQKLKNTKEILSTVDIFQCDHNKYEDIIALSSYLNEYHDGLNIIINNAGIMRTINLLAHDLKSALTDEIDINLKGSIWTIDVLLPLLKHNNHAAIVNVSSGLAFSPFPISPIYSASKAALHSFTLSLRKQLAHVDIKVFELAPPTLKTDMFNTYHEDDKKGIVTMDIDTVVQIFIKNFEKDTYEICPGQSKQLKFMGRFFPSFILSQMSQSLRRFHA